MRTSENRWLLAAFLSVAIILPSQANAQESTSNLWDRVPADILELIPDDLRPEPAEEPGSDDVRKTVSAMLAAVQERSPEVNDALLAWESRDRLNEKKRQILAHYLEENKSRLEVLQTIPIDGVIHIRDQWGASELSTSLSRFMYLGFLDASFLADRREYEAAVQRLAGLLQFTKLLYRSEARSGFYAGCGGWHFQTIGIARRIARYEGIPADLLLTLVRTAESTLPDESAKPCLRRNFELCALPVLAGLSVDESLSESIKRQVRIWGPKSTAIRGFDLERELEERSRQILALLEGHPDPFDRNATIALILTQYEQSARVAEGSLRFSDRTSPDYINEVACWPDEVALHPLWVFRLMLHDGQEAIPQEKLQRLRTRLATISNPFGKHLASCQRPLDTVTLPLTYSARSRCELVALAARAYHQRFHLLPASLGQLAEAEILTQVPRDPYGSELRYSRKKRIVWSVGCDGRDDGGRFENQSDSLDFLRFMAPPGLVVPETEAPGSPEADDRATKILLPKVRNRPPVTK